MNTINKDVHYTTSCYQSHFDQHALQTVISSFEGLSMPWYYADCKGELLGMNRHFCQWVGLSKKAIAGATLAMFYADDAREKTLALQQKVIADHTTLSEQETLMDANNKPLLAQSTQIPLYNNQQHVIAVIYLCHPLSTTAESKNKFDHNTQQFFQHLQGIADTIPVPFYWFDLSYALLGGNELFITTMGFSAKEFHNLLGKTAYDVYPKSIADDLTANQRTVAATNRSITTVEIIKDVSTGKMKYYDATLAPLHDAKGDVIAVYGVSIDVTAQKEAEELRLEREVHTAKLDEQKRFMVFISQAVHDIGSPLAVLKMLLNACRELEANKLRGLNDAVDNINAIANDLLVEWTPKSKQGNEEGSQAHQPMLIALVLLETLAAKRIEYSGSGLTFEHDFSQESYFACITGDVFAFKRSISNIINNAVGAYDNKKGVIRCHLMLEDGQVVIQLQDEGKGIPPDVLEKLRKAVSVTSGKKDGHGIGMTQVRDTVETFGGTLSMDSTVGQGTTIELRFPQLPTVDWLAHDITLNADDTVVVVDDVESIHEAWKIRFQESGLTDYLKQHTVHFTQGQEAIDYVQGIEDKSKVFLLSDYELHHQALNGIDVLEQSGIPRAVLSTSHYAKEEVQAFAAKTSIKILPKPLAAEIPIHFDVMPVEDQRTQQEEVADALVPNHKQVDLVMVDDDASFASTLVFALESEDKVVDLYQRPQAFLDKFDHYSKETKISLDYEISESMDGLQLAEKLYQAGYKNLYLLSGRKAHEFSLPPYITFVSKGDIIKKTPLELFWPEEA